MVVQVDFVHVSGRNIQKNKRLHCWNYSHSALRKVTALCPPHVLARKKNSCIFAVNTLVWELICSSLVRFAVLLSALFSSPIRWGYIAVLKNEMSGLTFNCPSAGAPCPVHTGEDALVSLEEDAQPSIGVSIAILLSLSGAFLLLAWQLMKFTMKKR
jgi:hypothetical protein